MTYVLRFKNNYELPVHCDEADINIDPASGNLESIDFRGVVNNMPVYFNPEDILCVYKLIDGENKVGGGINKYISSISKYISNIKTDICMAA